MTVSTMALRGLAAGILSGMRDGSPPGSVLITGSMDDASAVAGYLAAKSGARLCPLGGRVVSSQRGRDAAVDCVARIAATDGTVVLLDLDTGGCDWTEMLGRLRTAAADAGNCAIVAGTASDDVDHDLAACFAAVGALDESGFVAHTGLAAPEPRP